MSTDLFNCSSNTIWSKFFVQVFCYISTGHPLCSTAYHWLRLLRNRLSSNDRRERRKWSPLRECCIVPTFEAASLRSCQASNMIILYGSVTFSTVTVRLINKYIWTSSWITFRTTCTAVYSAIRTPPNSCRLRQWNVTCFNSQVALAYLHSNNIVHRDIKPENILWDPRSNQIKICDFESAKEPIVGKTNIAYICSRYYRAPELSYEAKYYSSAVDIWSAGCVMAEILPGHPLFAGQNSFDQLIEIMKVLGTPSPSDLVAMNPDYNSCPFPFPQIKKRDAIRGIQSSLRHQQCRLLPIIQWFHLIVSMLTYNPSKRITALQMMEHPFFDHM